MTGKRGTGLFGSGARLFLIGFAAFLSFAAAAWAGEFPQSPLAFEARLDGKKEADSLSGAACSAKQWCLMVGDEKRYARFFRVEGGRIVAGRRFYLLPDARPDGIEWDEADAEGIAFSEDAFFVVGSHSRDKSGAVQRSRHFVWRIPVAPDSGLPADFGSLAESRSLDAVIAAEPRLAAHVQEAPGEGAHGVNIEGLAIHGGSMFVGFRGPVENGRALILRLDGEALFDAREEGETPPPLGSRTFPVALGPGQGVRDLASVRGGLLILAGPEMRADPQRPELFLWNPATERLASLGRFSVGNRVPESITLLEESAGEYRLLVLSEGDPNGSAVEIRVPKPEPSP